MKTKRSSVDLPLWSLLLTLFFNLTLIAQCPTPPRKSCHLLFWYVESLCVLVYRYGKSSGKPVCYVPWFFTLPETFNNDLAGGSIAGPNICGTYSDTFAIRMRMRRTFAPGNYTFTVGGDDGYRLSLDGGATFIINNWSDRSYGTTTSAVVYLDGPVNVVLEYYEKFGLSRVSYSFNACASSTAPTAINAPTASLSKCRRNNFGCSRRNAWYWSRFSMGNWHCGDKHHYNHHWKLPLCKSNSDYYLLGSSHRSSALRSCHLWREYNHYRKHSFNHTTTISGTTTICAGQSTTLTVSGGTHGTGAVYEWGTGYNAGVNVIAGATGSSITVSPTSQTGYWVRRVDPAPCPANNSGHITTTVNVNPSSTAPTTITPSATAICPGNSVTLTASGGTALSGSTFQWGTGATIGSNVISGQTGASITVSPSTTTTYWFVVSILRVMPLLLASHSHCQLQ